MRYRRSSALLGSLTVGVLIAALGCGVRAEAPAAVDSPVAVECPVSFRVDQSARATPTGWEAVNTAREHKLIGITLFDGPPADEASLAPSSSEPTGITVQEASPNSAATRQIWTFEPGAKSSRIWLECTYDRTGFVLRRVLPSGTKRCEVVLSDEVSLGGLPAVLSMHCQ